jgi:hypothetical protein
MKSSKTLEKTAKNLLLLRQLNLVPQKIVKRYGNDVYLYKQISKRFYKFGLIIGLPLLFHEKILSFLKMDNLKNRIDEWKGQRTEDRISISIPAHVYEIFLLYRI